MINDILKNLLNVTVIADLNNILIYLKNFAKYKKHVKQIFRYLAKYNFCFKSEKCKWFKKKVKFLEFMIERNLI